MGDTPYRIVFKDFPRTMLHVAADLVYSESTDEHQLPTVYADQEQEKVAEMYANVESRSKQMKEARHQQYQKKVQNFRKYKIGDLVWITATSRRVKKSRSLSPRWTGSYTIIQPLSDVVYLLQRCRGKKVISVHHDRMKPYKSRPVHLTSNERSEVICQPIGNLLDEIKGPRNGDVVQETLTNRRMAAMTIWTNWRMITKTVWVKTIMVMMQFESNVPSAIDAAHSDTEIT